MACLHIFAEAPVRVGLIRRGEYVRQAPAGINVSKLKRSTRVCSSGTGGQTMRGASVACLTIVLACCGCSQSQESDVTGSTAACANRLYSPYNAKDFKQCVDVCIQCSR